MAYNTGNPIGSTSPKDLSDNARNLDLLLLGDDPSYPDRKRIPRKSWRGMEGEFSADQVRRRSEFTTDQQDREAQFKALMDASGHEPPVLYAPGINLVRTTQTVTYLGNEYRVKSQYLPLTTTDWASDKSKFKLIGDESLRQEMADPSKGAFLSAFGRKNLPDGLRSAGSFLSAQRFSLWEFDYAITDRPDPNDPSTWDWYQAVKAAMPITKHGVLYMPPYIKYRFSKSVPVPVNSKTWTTIVGEKNLTTIVLDPGVPTAFCFADSVPYDTVQNICIGGFVVDASLTDGTDGAVIFGGRQGGVEAMRLNYDQIHLFDLQAFGMSSDTAGGKFRVGIHLSSIFGSPSDAPTTMTNIYIDRIRLEGGITGLYMGAGVPGSNDAPLWMDEIYITDFWHDTLVEDAGYPAAGIQVGQDGCGGKIRVHNAWSANGGDVGIELNGFYDAKVTDSVLDRPGTGFWSYNYHRLSDPKKQKVIWENCGVIRPRNNPGWRIGRTKGGHFSLINCWMEVDELCDPRVLDFASGSLEGLEKLTIKGFVVYVKTALKADYPNLAASLSLHLNVPEWSLDIDDFTVIYEGEAPRASHECAALIFNSLSATSLVRVKIQGLKVKDKRSGTLLSSDAIRVYGSARLYGVIDEMVVDSTVVATQAKHGIRVAASSVPAPELKVRDSDLSGCTSLYELSTITAVQRNNILWDNVKFNKQFDESTRPSNPPVTAGEFLYRNAKGQPVRVVVSAGAGVSLDVSQDGVDFYPLGAIAGTFDLEPNEFFRIRSTVAPNFRVMVKTRITV